MSLTLGDDDRRAVDMLLNRDGESRAYGNGGHADGNGGTSTAAAAMDGQFHQRIQRVEQILHVLSNMPATEPSPDMVQRVLRRTEEMPEPTAPVLTHPSVEAPRPTA